MKSEWAVHMTGPELIPLDKPCDDCAVTCGFYLPYSERLVLEDAETQNAVKRRWFCHNNRDRACRGNWNYLERAKA